MTIELCELCGDERSSGCCTDAENSDCEAMSDEHHLEKVFAMAAESMNPEDFKSFEDVILRLCDHRGLDRNFLLKVIDLEVKS